MDEKIFTELLFADVVRGRHATGVATVKGQCRQVHVHKRALPSPLYLELGSTAEHLRSFINNTVVLGHNRHATKGNSSDPEGAHPFQHDHITLVHNGSLTTHASLTTENFTVDSEAICKAIAVDGIEVVAPKLRGAFALVWINSEDNTLNFLRNGEREFAIAWNEAGNRMWWASEKGMLEWSLNRDTFSRTPVTYNECFELPVGKWISIPITHSSINIAGRTETELDVSNSVYVSTYGGYQGYQAPKSQSTEVVGNVTSLNRTILERQATGKPLANETVTEYKFGVTRELALKKLTAELVSERGRGNFMTRAFVSSLDMNTDAAVLDERIGLFITNWEAYAYNSSGLGTLNGQMMEYPYTTVAIHGFTEAEYDKLYHDTDGMITGYLSGFILPTAQQLTIKSGSVMDQDNLSKFSLILRKDTIRKADLDDYYWDLDKMPAEDSKVYAKASEIDSKLLRDKEDDVPPFDADTKLSHDDPLLVFKLPDGSKVSPDGTAIYKGTSKSLSSGFRYKIVSIKYQETTKTMMLTAILGGDRFIFPADNWMLGTLSREADTSDDPEAVIGPDGEYLSVGKWRVAVSKGCCHCKEIPSDPRFAEDLEWVGTRFTCGPCVFELANVGYS